MIVLHLSDLPNPTKWPGANARLLGAGGGLPISPLQRLSLFDDTEFERFTLEWAHGYVKRMTDAVEVQWRGGSGDKGRDVVLWLDPSEVTPRRSRIYQCKHYSSRLGVSSGILEIGKVLYYTWRGDYPVPEEYQFVTHLGVSSDFQDLLDVPSKLKQHVENQWDSKCKTAITSKESVPLEGALKSHFDAFDFSIFKAKQPLELIDEHAQTKYHQFVFGPPLIDRPDPPQPPSTITATETVYVRELLKAISVEAGCEISSEEDLALGTPMERLFSRSRLSFYSAEGLKELSRDHMADAAYFTSLLDEFEQGLYHCYTDPAFHAVQRLRETIKGAQSLQLGGHVLSAYVNSADREGMCHQLSNSREVKWCE